ncbi:MAG: polysaccharide biosynthesis protein [Bacteroidetes bacterium]|nr:MAG: polysaccharide biosynthesis protein [Bacteroidota bacterium]
MGSVKKLAGQTLWYGVPTIASRFLGYLLSIFLFRLYGPVSTADITQVYALIPFLNILFTYGLETAYFRFAQTQSDTKTLYNTLTWSLVLSTLLFSALLLHFTTPLAQALSLGQNPEYFKWMVYILFFDTLSVLPFAQLRQTEQPRKYALIRVISVIVPILIVVYYLLICPPLYAQNPQSLLLWWYRPNIGVGYYIIANAVASALTFLLLFGQWKSVRLRFDPGLWKKTMVYAYPLVIVGFGGMINEMLSRLMYSKVLDLAELEEKRQLGIFGASYKVAVLITMFIQVFKMAAEPFFFKQSTQANAQRTYARVTKFFVIACCFMWLGIALNLPWIARLAYGKNYAEYAEGTSIIPILAMGSVFLGVYYNLSVWYKLTNKNWTGAWITIAGAVITVLLNLWWIPYFGYNGSAWATCICYFFMLIASYVLGQKHYRIPYAWKKLTAYLTIAILLYGVQQLTQVWVTHNVWVLTAVGVALFVGYAFFIARIERKELAGLPIIGKWMA